MDDDLSSLEAARRRAPDDLGVGLRLAAAYGRAGRPQDGLDLLLHLATTEGQVEQVRASVVSLTIQLVAALDGRLSLAGVVEDDPTCELAGPFDAHQRTTWAGPGSWTRVFATTAPTQLRCNRLDAASLAAVLRIATLERVIFTPGVRPVLRDLARLPWLRTLDLAGTDLRDDDLVGLPACSALESIDLSDTRVSDAGLGHLAGCRNLRRLRLAGCQRITNRGVARLAPLRRLQHLDLTGVASVTSTSLRPLGTLPELAELLLDGTRVADVGPFNEPGAFLRLHRLRLPRATITRVADELPPRHRLRRWVAALTRGDTWFRRRREGG